MTQLVYEETGDVRAAIAREKQTTGWLRRRNVALIEARNPFQIDLSDTWYAAPAANAG